MRTQDNFTRVLLETNMLRMDDILRYSKQAANYQQTLFQYITQHRLIDPEKLARHCADYFQLKEIDIDTHNKQRLPFHIIPFNTLKKQLIIPVKKNETECIIAIGNPDDISISKTLSFQFGITTQVVFARYDILQSHHNHQVSQQAYEKTLTKTQSIQTFTHDLLSDAIHRHASDIHIEPYQQYLRIRFRIDGLLHEIIQLPHEFTDTITSCLKVLANLDISIKRLPQDGRLSFQTPLGYFKNCRLNTCPTQHGEKLVVRLLEINTKISSLKQLGLNKKNQKIISSAIEKPQGLILVTGPTGSGKTITLYTLLNLLNQPHRNIATIEDPIEIQIDGINQTTINTKNGLTFSNTLRTLLRQDPDVMMIGEIRDQETAEMAIRAAQTGHLVLSTLHTNSAAEAITRLSHMGIKAFHLASALTLIIAQRLVRCLCPYCENKTAQCTHCINGFTGRTGIFELLPINPEIKKMILENEPHTNLSAKNKSLGNMNLWEAGIRCTHKNITTLSELYRCIPSE